jgi:hypothetical protein
LGVVWFGLVWFAMLCLFDSLSLALPLLFVVYLLSY